MYVYYMYIMYILCTGWKEIYGIISLAHGAESHEAMGRCMDAFELPIYEVLFHMPFTLTHVSGHRSLHVLYVTPFRTMQSF